MERIFSEHTRQMVEPSDFLDLVSHRNPTHNIINLRAVVGDEKYILLLDKFSGSYTRFPTAKNLMEAIQDIVLVRLWEEVKEKKASQNLAAWNEADARFVKQAQRMGMEYKAAVRRAKGITKELVVARNWANEHELSRGQKAGVS